MDGFPPEGTGVLCCHQPHQPGGGLQRQVPGAPFLGRVREKGRWTHLRGECWLPPRPLLIRRRQRRAPRGCCPASLVFRAGPRAFRVAEEDARRGGLCIQARSPRAAWPVQRALLSKGGERSAASCRLPLAPRQLRPLPSSQPVPPRYFLLFPARSCQRLGFLKMVNYAAFVCGVGRWGQG